MTKGDFFKARIDLHLMGTNQPSAEHVWVMFDRYENFDNKMCAVGSLSNDPINKDYSHSDVVACIKDEDSFYGWKVVGKVNSLKRQWQEK